MYQTPFLYMMIHILIGAIAYNYPLWIGLFLVYQFLQYGMGVRFFLFSWEVKDGNSFVYTLYKLAQFAFGLGAAMIVDAVASCRRDPSS
jgi:hypothetical protein